MQLLSCSLVRTERERTGTHFVSGSRSKVKFGDPEQRVGVSAGPMVSVGVSAFVVGVCVSEL